jgi:hypothetical protein
MIWLASLGLGILLLAYAGLCVLSFWWLLNAGDVSAVKPASWVAKALYWHGAFIFGALMLGGALAIALTLARVAWGGR